jgi:glycosyltransferase involved in cell wall biosynthesis
MCNTRFLDVVARFRELDCKIVWLGCMNWLFPSERRHYREFGTFDRYVFQSRFQHDELCGQLAKYGYRESQGRVIHGAFDIEDFPFRPLSHEPGQTFVVGHLSRAATEKFSPRLWNVWGQVASPMCARVMGWSRAVQTRVGRPPRWAECLPAGFETSQSFLASVQCLSPMGDTIENWPQVGLEAMASGVPLVVENQGGWMEMIRHGQTGFLCDSDAEMVEAVSRLARDEPLRQDVIENARHVVEKQWANVQTWWDAWSDLLKDTAGNDENCRRLCDV